MIAKNMITSNDTKTLIWYIYPVLYASCQSANQHKLSIYNINTKLDRLFWSMTGLLWQEDASSLLWNYRHKVSFPRTLQCIA